MTELQKLDHLKILLTITDNREDGLLSTLLSIAGQKILDRVRPYRIALTVVPERYHIKQIEIAVFLYNKQGAEGQTAHNENGINRSYESADVPESLMRGITPYAEVVGFASPV